MKKVIGQIACGQPITAEETAKAAASVLRRFLRMKTGNVFHGMKSKSSSLVITAKPWNRFFTPSWPAPRG